MARCCRSLPFSILLVLLRPTEEIVLAQQPATAARLGLDACVIPNLVELGLKPAAEPARNLGDHAWLRASAATR